MTDPVRAERLRFCWFLSKIKLFEISGCDILFLWEYIVGNMQHRSSGKGVISK